MRGRNFGFGCTLLLAGCLSPIPAPPTVIAEPLIVPAARLYIDSNNPTNRISLINYRDALVGYHRYLVDYISFFSIQHGLPPPTFDDLKPKPKPCPIDLRAKPVYIDPLPDTSGDLSDFEINIILLEYVQSVKQTLKEHNRQIAVSRELAMQTCGM